MLEIVRTRHFTSLSRSRVWAKASVTALSCTGRSWLTGSLTTEHVEDRAMELNDIRQLYDCNRWARRRILTVCSTLASDDFVRPMSNTFPQSVTLSLTFWAQSGSGWNALLDAETFPTVQESRWETVEHDQMQFIEALTPQRLGEELAYINQKGQRYTYLLWQQLVHIIKDSSYHRGR